jgi:hypothetical protein
MLRAQEILNENVATAETLLGPCTFWQSASGVRLSMCSASRSGLSVAPGLTALPGLCAKDTHSSLPLWFERQGVANLQTALSGLTCLHLREKTVHYML